MAVFSSIHRVCVQWPRFGPYHLARLKAAHAFLQERGVELIGLETAGNDNTYAWRPEQGNIAFQRIQIFPSALFEDLPPALIHDGITKTLDRLQPDAVAINSYSLPDARACLAWCRRNRRVAVLMTDSKEDDAPRSAWREQLKARLVHLFDAALVAGTPQQAYFEKLGFPTSCIFLGYDVVDNAFFAERAQKAREQPADWHTTYNLPPDQPFFLTVNRFLPIKNLDGLLQAYQIYSRHADSPWPLVLVGDGPERASLEKLTWSLGLEQVIFAGFCQIDVLPAFYAHAGAFIHPTFKDTWGLVVNEAMAAGLPVVVSERAGCVPDLVHDGENGFSFDPSDQDQLAWLMQNVAAPTTDRSGMGRRSEEIISHWSLERFSEALWQAVQTGATRAHRLFNPSGRLLLWMLHRTAHSVTSFHSMED